MNVNEAMQLASTLRDLAEHSDPKSREEIRAKILELASYYESYANHLDAAMEAEYLNNLEAYSESLKEHMY